MVERKQKVITKQRNSNNKSQEHTLEYSNSIIDNPISNDILLDIIKSSSSKLSLHNTSTNSSISSKT